MKTGREQEIRDYRARLAILGAELNSKNDLISSIQKERQDLEELSIKVMSMGMQITDQTTEIERLNAKYAETLEAKVRLYP